ncbi:glycoside hydrolase family 3 N-terminal domain-containing protein [Agriterribacter sp.]|uniref:glycoside hydrolase family 3 N-terminal domain-containing protein n=1 Tax=Agriterribacter sp. TaxID=2821509 RepID=UPI002BDC3FFC|nr:glycoside hydrolase family 3 N-terminal domain-containing protein [Agriterribacter sp.]HTN05343.1 glycoside hydrolase family 3 N-terminal domain-containing protein [Agriterribacter sp.]
MKKLFFVTAICCISLSSAAQHISQLDEQAWVDSVFAGLSDDEKLGQLMVVRLSSIDASRRVTFYDEAVQDAINKYNVGGICLFQGGPVTQAEYVNRLQAMARTPLLICIDAENGLGMRMDSVTGLPRQMMMGAVQDPKLIYAYGKWVGEQCKRAGIQVNYAPVVDINNNPNNPVINDRSFGENKYKVAEHGIMYMKGMQDMGVMACAKHFPGHGDVAVDSHYDLPVINKTREQLDSLELYPFRELFRAGVGSVMIAHLFIPAIDNTANRPTSLSYNNVTKLLREELGYKGLTFTDALEMQGVKKFFPDGEASAESLIAGNDMLCLPGDIAASIEVIKKAIKRKKLGWSQVDESVKKVLRAKYKHGLSRRQPVNTHNLVRDLNAQTPDITKSIAENAITALRLDDAAIPLLPLRDITKAGKEPKVAYIGFGINNDNAFARLMRGNYNADVFYFSYNEDASRVATLAALLETRYDAIVIGIHHYNRFPAGNFGISTPAIQLLQHLQPLKKTISFVFGNPYIIKNFCDAKNMIACYEDDAITHQAAADVLKGAISTKGKLPVTVCDAFPSGTGINTITSPVSYTTGEDINAAKFKIIDSIATEAIQQHAAPGMAIMAVKDGKIVFHKAYGYYTYDSTEKVNLESIYDLASVTKICATTLSVMKLYDQGKLDLNKTLGDYLPWVKGTNKQNLKIDDILLHQAGLNAFIPFYRETIDSATGIPLAGFYSAAQTPQYHIKVADTMYMRNSWEDTIYKRIIESPVGPRNKYIYSDNDFIFLGKIVEAISGMPLNEYVYREFYRKLGLTTTGFLPLQRFPEQRIPPTEHEQIFRRQLLRGTVHDPGAAMFGGVAGHAGLFSDAYDLAVMMQMLLEGGKFNGYYFFSPETIKLFTDYSSKISRRGLGFDKPEKDNAISKDPYPCRYASPLTFGHTGYTGTCVWVDPKYNLTFIFLSNRVNPEGGTNVTLYRLNTRTNIQDAIYKAVTESGK